ncbi:MAG: V-type ATP synthase subunit E [Candidatus Thorarchaeota archaeon]
MSAEEERINLMVEDIITNAKAQADKNLSEAKKQTKEILEKAKDSADKEKNTIIDSESKMITELEKQQISSINLQSRREILQKKEEEIIKAFELAKEELKKFPSKAAYTKTLEALILEAGKAIGGGDLLVRARKEDKTKLADLTNLAKEITKITNTKTTIKIDKETIDSIGGVIVLLEDESITIDNTFEARMNQKYRIIRNKVAKTLFN